MAVYSIPITLLLLLISIIWSVCGHTEIVKVNGGTLGIRRVTKIYPVFDLSRTEMRCGNHSRPSTGVLKVKSGDLINLNYYNAGLGEFTPKSHRGPCAAYISESRNPNKFSKIFENGFDGNGVSCNDRIAANGKLSFSLPTNLKSGKYILRIELVALHRLEGGAEFFPQCVDISVTGPGNGVGVGKNAVPIPGYLNKNSPGVKFNIYKFKTKVVNYPIPGPKIDPDFIFGSGS